MTYSEGAGETKFSGDALSARWYLYSHVLWPTLTLQVPLWRKFQAMRLFKVRREWTPSGLKLFHFSVLSDANLGP